MSCKLRNDFNLNKICDTIQYTVYTYIYIDMGILLYLSIPTIGGILFHQNDLFILTGNLGVSPSDNLFVWDGIKVLMRN